jgi:hypothetical protein
MGALTATQALALLRLVFKDERSQAGGTSQPLHRGWVERE